MKKVLLGTSAIALAGAFASQASANEWQVRVGGYMEQFVAYSETDDDLVDAATPWSVDFDGIENKEDSEIHFSPSITLDNGLQVGARIELEGRTQGDQIDETYMNISGSFGTIRLGEDDQAAYNMAYTAPDVTFLNINSGSDTKFWGGGIGSIVPGQAMLTQFTTTLPQVAFDPQGISYYSPRLAGFQIGASYARDGNRATVQAQVDQDATLALTDLWSVGANYVNSFGDFNVAVSGGYAAGDGGLDGPVPALDEDHEAWAAALNLGYAGFTIGGSYKEYDVDNDAASPFDDITGAGFFAIRGAEGFSNTAWDAGVSYETGPWGFSFTYLRFEDDVSNVDFDLDKYLVGMNYALAQGVRLNAFGVYGDAELNVGGSSFDADGWIVGSGIRIDF